VEPVSCMGMWLPGTVLLMSDRNVALIFREH
jgi:hypothetical protein